jgi:hypothetical protein
MVELAFQQECSDVLNVYFCQHELFFQKMYVWNRDGFLIEVFTLNIIMDQTGFGSIGFSSAFFLIVFDFPIYVVTL